MTVELGPSQKRVQAALDAWGREPPCTRFGNHLLLGMRGTGKTTLLRTWGDPHVRIITGPDLLGWLIERYPSPFAILPGQLASAVVEFARELVPEYGWGAVLDAWVALQPYLCNRQGDSVRQFVRALEEAKTWYRLLIWEIPTDGPQLPASSSLKEVFDARVRVDGRERAHILSFTTEDGLVLYGKGRAASSTVQNYYEARLTLVNGRQGGASGADY